MAEDLTGGFPRYQISTSYGAFTMRADTWEEFQEQLLKVAGQEAAEHTLRQLKTEFANWSSGDRPSSGGGGGFKKKEAAPADPDAPSCSHGPMAKRTGAKGTFYACQGKDANGDFLWKSRRACPSVNA